MVKCLLASIIQPSRVHLIHNFWPTLSLSGIIPLQTGSDITPRHSPTLPDQPLPLHSPLLSEINSSPRRRETLINNKHVALIFITFPHRFFLHCQRTSLCLHIRLFPVARWLRETTLREILIAIIQYAKSYR